MGSLLRCYHRFLLPFLRHTLVAVAVPAECFDNCHPRQPAYSGPGANGLPAFLPSEKSRLIEHSELTEQLEETHAVLNNIRS